MKIYILLILIAFTAVNAVEKKHHSKSRVAARHHTKHKSSMKVDPIPVNLPDVTQTG